MMDRSNSSVNLPEYVHIYGDVSRFDRLVGAVVVGIFHSPQDQHKKLGRSGLGSETPPDAGEARLDGDRLGFVSRKRCS